MTRCQEAEEIWQSCINKNISSKARQPRAGGRYPRHAELGLRQLLPPSLQDRGEIPSSLLQAEQPGLTPCFPPKKRMCPHTDLWL